MGRMIKFLRSALAMLLASFVTLSSFGLVLGLLWALGDGGVTTELVSAFLAAALALTLGGFSAVWVAGEKSFVISLLYGFLAGTLSFTYILGPGYPAIALGLAASTFAGMGGLGIRAWRLNREGHMARPA